MKSYVCKSCGAELLLNNEATFTTCLYCGNNIAFTDKAVSELNIKKIIPFSISKEDAIKNFKKILNKDIIEVKKVYVPVRFCNYDFDYLIYYEYVVSDSDDKDHYYDTERLIDGSVKNEFIFSESKINNVLYLESFNDMEKVNFDPVLLNDVSIEYAPFSEVEKIKTKLNKDVLAYCIKKIKDRITQIYSLNYFTYNIDIDSFSTLLPVYIVKTSNGMIYNLPGVPIKKKETFGVKNIAIIISIIIFCYLMICFLSNVSNYGLNMVSLKLTVYVSKNFIETAIFGGIIWGIIFFIVKKLKINKINKINKTYDNFKSEQYYFGNHRKRLK